MIGYTQSTVVQAAAHVVGNGVNGERLKLSEEPLEIEDENLQKLLLTYFLSSFTAPEYYHFTSEDGSCLSNPLYDIACQMFSDPATFHQNSVRIAERLYESTLLPTIKSGDLIVAHLSTIQIGNELLDAIAICKSENKDSFLKLNTSGRPFKLKADVGIGVRKVDKGCLILKAEKELGFRILAVDNLNKIEAQFWMNDFLQVKPREDNFHLTRNFMNLTRQYVDDQLDEEFSVSKADKVELLNKSRDFFKSKEQFNQHEFEAEVLGDPSVIESFRNYERTLMADKEKDIVDNFEISAHAVKQQVRVFKSVIKLDKNFHIYIHGNRQLLEKGFDEENNKHYYKLYFDQES